MPDEFGEKTEPATDRRRTEAREKGNVPRSIDLSAAALMMATAGLIRFLGLPLVETFADVLQLHLGRAGWTTLEPEFVVRWSHELAGFVGTTVLTWMLLLFVASVFVNVVQIGFLVAPSALEPKLSRINPWEGVKRIISIRALVKLGTSLGKLIVIVTISLAFLYWTLPDLVGLQSLPPRSILVAIHERLSLLAFLLALGLLVLALADFGFQRWKHEQDLMMSKQEIREEMKQMDGDPYVRQRRRDAHRKLAQAREIQGVKGADVVVTNPTHYAVALVYDPEINDAPIVIAKGVDEIAIRIREVAAANGVTILERPEVARALYADVRVGHPIPADLYEVFVEIMAYVYRVTGRTPPGLDA